MIRVLVADDHPVVRRGLSQILSDEPDMQVIAEAQNATEVLREMRKEESDVVVLDITMPGRSGLEVLNEIQRDHPAIPVLVLSMHPEDQFGLRVLRAGASGYMTKESVPGELVKAIRKVCTGSKYFSSALAQRVAIESSAGAVRLGHENLSDREFQVMQLLAGGQMVKEIAAELSLSIKTVSTYRTRILRKLHLNNNAELTMYAIEHHLLPSREKP